ncbi:hypothetical protein NEHOM01_0346 [Nematocida homosporus]|uniref:uncharacterized protein n=1 Tax=Nematocida homosporus TaxID=1912981 RepID=UPI00221E5FE0|nr:uncharacterized protein NEHOM01_0346 [Nematocida homosporus]KAI5184744.1 hypothetical protein NEHOM01_0346 [Nematocida homosporus]
MKRVRSKKIESEKKLAVLYERDLDPIKLQDYAGVITATGVEKEEEEEHHLKEVILGREKSIPTPAALKLTPPQVKKQKMSGERSDLSQQEVPDGYLPDIGDVPIPDLNQPDTQIALKEDAVPTYLAPYVCFRKREVKTLRKARKPDTSIEKIKRIKVDLQMIKRLTELTLQRDTYLLQHLNSILSIFSICREMNKRLDIGVLNISESILRDILFTKLLSKNDLFYKKIPSFTNLYTCRKSIGSLRKLFKAGPSPEDALTFNKKQLDYLNTF